MATPQKLTGSTFYFDRPFETGFAYGDQEYITVTHPDFKIGDQIEWKPSNYGAVIRGTIEFIGSTSAKTQSGQENNIAYAIVEFTEPTCHLPGHISTPPSNRNIIPVAEITKYDQITLGDLFCEEPVTTSTPDGNTITIGLLCSCYKNSNDYEIVEDKLMSFKITDQLSPLTQCTIKSDGTALRFTLAGGKCDYVEVEFERRLVDLPVGREIVIRHWGDDANCDATCVLIPTNLLEQRKTEDEEGSTIATTSTASTTRSPPISDADLEMER